MEFLCVPNAPNASRHRKSLDCKPRSRTMYLHVSHLQCPVRESALELAFADIAPEHSTMLRDEVFIVIVECCHSPLQERTLASHAPAKVCCKIVQLQGLYELSNAPMLLFMFGSYN